jgi:hypothetical protein
MLRTDSLGLEWDDVVPALVLTADGGHYHHLRTDRIYSLESIDQMGLEFMDGELGFEGQDPTPPVPTPEPVDE